MRDPGVPIPESMARRLRGIATNLDTDTGLYQNQVAADPSNGYRATDVPLFAPAHPRWEFVFQPRYAAYRNLIEPWWKVLPSLARKGRRPETWDELREAVGRATAYWNRHRHPFLRGRRRRHRPRRQPGIAAVPGGRSPAG
jgi:hypothetical protein